MNILNIDNLPELPFVTKEAINQLRVNIGFSGQGIKTIMITSSTPNEGKSFVAVHLWKAIAEVNNKVLLIDCDLRNSVMKEKYGIHYSVKREKGIVHLLSGRCTMDEAVYQTNIPNAYIIPMEKAITNPMLLLEGENFANLMLGSVKDEYDYIIVDTPPLLNVADALSITKYCDGSVLVLRAGKTPRDIVRNSLQLLEKSEAPLLGVVMNRAGANAGSYGKYYKYGYSKYGYGYGYRRKES